MPVGLYRLDLCVELALLPVGSKPVGKAITGFPDIIFPTSCTDYNVYYISRHAIESGIWSYGDSCLQCKVAVFVKIVLTEDTSREASENTERGRGFSEHEHVFQ